MDTPNQLQPAGKSHAIYWVILVVVILAIAAGLYFVLRTSEPMTNSNATVNSNSALNANSGSNSNTTSNVNSANTNVVANTNATSTNTSDWNNYTNESLGFAIKYPESWSAETITTDVMDYQINDTKLSKGSCPATGCSIGIDLCEVVISSEPDATAPAISEPIAWIKALSSYTGAGVTTMTLGAYNAYETALAVTPAGINGNRSVGQYFLIALPTNNEFLGATLRKGFNNSTCKAEMVQLLQTISHL